MFISTGPPDAVSELQIEAIAANTAEISWFAGYDYKDKQTFTVLVYNSSVDTFTGMSQFYIYAYVVEIKAENMVLI